MHEISSFTRDFVFLVVLIMNNSKTFSTELACFEVNYKIFSKKIHIFSHISHGLIYCMFCIGLYYSLGP